MSDLQQERRVFTEIPGPRSAELMQRRRAALPAGVGTTLPVFAARAGRGIVEDVDGNRLVDFASGSPVTTAPAPAPRVVAAGTAQVAGLTDRGSRATPHE